MLYTELNFFIVACTFWICDQRFVDNTGMVLLLLSIDYKTIKPSLFLTPSHQQAGLGWARTWERTRLGQLIPNSQKGIPYYMMSCSAIETGGRKRKEACWQL